MHETETGVGGKIELADQFVHIGAWIAIWLICSYKMLDIVPSPKARRFGWVGIRMALAHSPGAITGVIDALARDVKSKGVSGLFVGWQSV